MIQMKPAFVRAKDRRRAADLFSATLASLVIQEMRPGRQKDLRDFFAHIATRDDYATPRSGTTFLAIPCRADANQHWDSLHKAAGAGHWQDLSVEHREAPTPRVRCIYWATRSARPLSQLFNDVPPRSVMRNHFRRRRRQPAAIRQAFHGEAVKKSRAN